MVTPDEEEAIRKDNEYFVDEEFNKFEKTAAITFYAIVLCIVVLFLLIANQCYG